MQGISPFYAQNGTSRKGEFGRSRPQARGDTAFNGRGPHFRSVCRAGPQTRRKRDLFDYSLRLPGTLSASMGGTSS